MRSAQYAKILAHYSSCDMIHPWAATNYRTSRIASLSLYVAAHTARQAGVGAVQGALWEALVGGPRKTCNNGHRWKRGLFRVDAAGAKRCSICSHQSIRYHVWKNGKCAICGKSQRGSLERNIADFWAKIDKNGPIVRPELGRCWQWTASIRSHGAGQVMWRGKIVTAHRVVWELTSGAVPPGLCSLHKCDNPRCCNPDHLFLGTQKDNCIDKIRKGRATSKLTVADVMAIRRDNRSDSALAARHGVKPETIRRARAGETWAALIDDTQDRQKVKK